MVPFMKLLSSKPPWYVAGLAFECTQCGRCCAGPEEGYVWVTAEEIVAIATHLDISKTEMGEKHCRLLGGRYSLAERPGNRDCVFLTCNGQGERGCRIYPVRPMQCRTWPFWPINLSSPETWALSAARCPGINRGCVLTLKDIEGKRHDTPG